jgi:hypothetical protein
MYYINVICKIMFFANYIGGWNVTLLGLSPQANYTERATAAYRRSWYELLRLEGVAWSAQRIPTTVFSVF